MISIKNVSFAYHKNEQVLKNVSFDIKDGECLVLLGPNGVGKSTLISLILKANKFQEGEITFDGVSIKDLKSDRKAEEIAYVPQLVEGSDLTVKDTILLGRLPFYKIYPSKTDYEYASSIIKEFGLEKLQDKQTNEISGGERQKVSVARGFIQKSKTIIFDEPTSNLDVKSQMDVLNLIKNEKDKNQRSFLISMHDINQALMIGDRFVFLKNGEVHSIANKEDITEELLFDVYGVKSKIIKENDRRIVYYEN